MSYKFNNLVSEEKIKTRKKNLMSIFQDVRVVKSISNLFSDEGLTKKATFNAVASFLEYAANFVVTFILTPMIVAYLGEYFYGVWQVLNRIVGYINPTSGRPAYALKSTIANQRESDDYEEKRRQVNNSILVWVIFLPINLCAGGIVTWYVPYWINAPTQYYLMIRIACALLVGNLIFSAVTQIPQSTLQGENKGYKRMGLSTILIFIENGLIWLVLYMGWGIIGIAAALLAATIVTGIFYLWVVRAYTPWFGVSKTSLKSLGKFLKLSWWFLGWNLVITLILSSDAVVLGIMQSVESVTSFTLTKYVPDAITSMVTLIVFGILPGLGGIIGTGNLEKATRVRGEIMTFTWLIVTTLGSTILLWNKPFLALWVGEKQYSGTLPNLLIIILATQLVFIRNDGSIIDLTLKLSKKVILGAISVAISVSLAVIAVGYLKLGIVGLCIGIIIGRSILSLGYPFLIGNLLQIHYLSQIKNVIKPFLITIFIYLTVTFIDFSNVIHTGSGVRGWAIFFVGVCITVILLLPLSFFLGLSRKQRQNILQRIRMVIQTAKTKGTLA